MTTLIIGLGVLLVLSILYVIFRIGTLLGLMDKKPKNRAPDNTIQAYLFLIFALGGMGLFFWYSFTHFDKYTLPVSSEHGLITDHLFWVTMVVTLAGFIPISLLMFWFVFKYRYQENRKAAFYRDNSALEILWTVIPAIVLSILVFRGLYVWSDITAPASDNAEVIEIVGQQFAWTVRYPGVRDGYLGRINYKLIDAVNEFGLDLTDKYSYDDFKSLELHLPKGKEVLLKIRSKDVLHSIFLPHFRVKMDAVPGMRTTFKFTPTKSTQEMRDELGNPDFNYELACAELCGKGHFSMRLLVIVDEPENYEAWKQDQQTWLKLNPDYLTQVPSDLHELAIRKSGLPIDYNTTSNPANNAGEIFAN